ncbi:GNAT family N-acetyltransferase [Kangiella aquimarina]|uniref:GNAT family N-acetyltransferase n=1 Tax=Kangiella aquimarina TaxID=261965 RepID=A0ABZ0X2W8_9GAMM|nr:GNAT family N-acetyltransferase [Kangiella aquimarina]WQG84898.1 GNAT family N-acetyltransferase [Kangiella aquimarina]
MSHFVIREAVRADAPLILGFIKELADYEKLSHEVVATVSDIEQTVFASDARAHCLIAEYEGQPAGFALYFFNYSTFLGKYGIYLEDLYVKPEFRGKKIGYGLLQKLAKIAVEKDCARVDWSVLDWNQPAIDFYKSIGAKPMDEWTVFRLTGDALDDFAKL